VARFAEARGLCVAALVLAMPASRAARGAEAPAMLVATPDPALLSALDAAFSPRGVRVAMADRPLRATSDDPGAGARGADLVWLCDVTPAPAAAPSSAGTAPPATALCVRPHQGTVIIRRVAVATPLSPEDAAALALSVQVALMPGAAPAPVAIASPAPAVEPTRADSAGSGGAHGLTLELSGGFRGGPAGKSSRASLSAVYAPGAFEHRFGVGAALGVGSTSLNDGTTVRGPGPPALPVVERNRDLTFRLFARGQASMGPIWLQLDVGPAAHATNSALGQPQGTNDNRLFWSLDSFLGAVVPLGPFFAGVRAGGELAVMGRSSASSGIGPWSTEALATFGVGWF
jgi:hypothetical protein